MMQVTRSILGERAREDKAWCAITSTKPACLNLYPLCARHLAMPPRGTPTQVSSNGNAQLIFQTDGNLVLYKILRDGTAKAAWATSTVGRAKGGEATLQSSDGNFVVTNTSGKAMWASGTVGVGHTVVMQTDCNLVILNEFGKPTWATGTWPC